ncbi:MAG TPA: PaaI family thioesterase [Actinomycetota bacterium]|nr:PaaI family thioesterase [Actinomycetota bacterium]
MHVWEEPVRGGYMEPGLLALPGIEQMRTFLRRTGPIPPLAYLTGCRPTEFTMGGATFVMPSTGWLQSPVGLITGGVLAVPGDGALGCAINTGLPAGTTYTTSEISMSFLRPASVDSKLFIARGKLIHGGRSLALSEATIEDGEGRLLAHSTSRCFVFPPMESLPELPDLQPWEEPEYETPPPFERPPVGETLDQEVFDKMSGLEVMKALIDGELAAPPIYHLTGLHPTEAADGTCTFTLHASPWLTSPVGTVQGGFLLMLADVALASAVQTTVPPGTAYATVDIKVNYLRPAYGDGSELLAHAIVVHRGRNLAVARAEVVNAAGKVVCLATGTSHILSGRNWAYEERA